MAVNEPIVSFHRLIEPAKLPQRCDRSALGTLPTRAYRYCDAVTSATGYGWWAYPPMTLQLIFDGANIFWHFEGAADWMPLQPAAQFPGFAETFDQDAPEALRGCSPPFLTALPEPGALQIWTGLMARTAPGWSLMVRSPANLPPHGGYTHYEGIVETDTWFGPLFTNLRLTQTNRPIKLSADFPLMQVQPLPRVAYAEETLSAAAIVPNMAHMPDDAWAAYRETIVIPTEDPERPFGAYAVAARKRRKATCPFSGKQGAGTAAA